MLWQVGVGGDVFPHIEACYRGEETAAVDYRLCPSHGGIGTGILFSRHENLHGKGGKDYRSPFGGTV